MSRRHCIHLEVRPGAAASARLLGRLVGAVALTPARPARVQARSQGSDVRRLAQAGIPCVADNSPFHMHHKFAIVDGATLLTGSLNWTVQAVQSNQENVIITDDAALVHAFAGCFAQLWRQFSGNSVR
jgi:phosphatidylserine/phosphatidylglycerophosphate/cardiolipin synthase-like enzyme